MGKILITVVMTAFLSLVTGIIIFHYTERSPKLTYEIFPVSSFPKENEKLSIYFVQVENSGNKEATDVQCTFIFPKTAKIVDHSVELSSIAMKYTTQNEKSNNQISFLLPSMNPSENCKFSLLVEMSGNEKVEIGVRGKGITGTQRITHVAPAANPLEILSNIFIGITLLIFVILFQKRREFRDFLAHFPNEKAKQQNGSDTNNNSNNKREKSEN
jgi:hypothetical protein